MVFGLLNSEDKRSGRKEKLLILQPLWFTGLCGLHDVHLMHVRLDCFFTIYFHYRQVYVLNVFLPIPTFPDLSAGNHRTEYKIPYRCICDTRLRSLA